MVAEEEMKALRLFCLAGVVACLAGCGTVMRGSTEDRGPRDRAARSHGWRSTTRPELRLPVRTGSRRVGLRRSGREAGLQEACRAALELPRRRHPLVQRHRLQHRRRRRAPANPTAVKLLCDDRQTVTISPYDDATIALLHGGQLEDEALPPVNENAYRGVQRGLPRGKLPKP